MFLKNSISCIHYPVSQKTIWLCTGRCTICKSLLRLDPRIVLCTTNYSFFFLLHFRVTCSFTKSFKACKWRKLLFYPQFKICVQYILFDIQSKISLWFVLGTRCFIRAWKRILSQILFYTNWWVMKCVFVKSWLLL